ncbi:MAG: peptidylprolyl isomerase [Bacteroidales bacterium]|nr:peptidylprolyl isomerase [Bacteroidales bacterium]
MLIRTPKSVLRLLIAAFFTASMGVTCAQQGGDPVVIILDKDSVTLSEFKKTFLKNNSLKNTTEKDLRDYVDLFVNFRLKCAEAREMHLDTLPSLKQELQGYRTQAAAPYLTEKSVNEQLVDEAIEHLHWDIRASHIMKRLPLSPLPEDTLKAYKEILGIRNRILKGLPFADAAVAESEDPSARSEYKEGKLVRSGNRGDLGYFTAFNMIYDFEKAAYNTPIGTISMPVRSPYGYHIIYVRDRKPAVSTFTAEQILITLPENATAADSAEAGRKAMEAYAALKKGMPFGEAAKRFSNDEGTVFNSGKIDPFPPARFEGDFVAPLYDTPEDSITRPFQTRYGWHIVKVTKKELFSETPNLRSDVKWKISRDSRSDLGPEKLVERLKKEYGFKEVVVKGKNAVSPMKEFYDIDSVLIYKAQWKKELFTSDKPMFTFADQTVRQSDFAAYIEKNQFDRMRKVPRKEFINYVYGQFVRSTILDYENSRLEEKYPEFAELMHEYEDGILLYELSERKVWGRSEKDSAGLEQFYETVKENHMYPVRAEAITYTLENDKDYKTFCKLMDKGLDMETISKKFAKKGHIITARREILQEGQDKDFDRMCPWSILMQEGHAVVTSASERRYTTVSRLLPSPKPLEEVRGVIITQYQNKLEQEWVESLRRNCNITINYAPIMNLIR